MIRPAERWGVRFGVPDGAYRDRQALIDSLRRELPAEGLVDVFVDGASWGPVDPEVPTRGAAPVMTEGHRSPPFTAPHDLCGTR